MTETGERGRPGTGGRPGQVVGDRYRLVTRLGEGGMGAVWSARDELVGREVAIKEAYIPGHLPPEAPARTVLAERIRREARAAARVEHPSVIMVHDVVVEDGTPWVVMERIRGESLAERLRRQQAMTEREAARVALPLLGALRAAHARGVLHRDVKPANVLLAQDGRVILTDFGIARIEGEAPLTRSGEFMGSFEYTAPERMGGRRAGPASDLWSLGVMLYEMVEGWSPFRRVSVEGTLAAVITATPERPVRAAQLGRVLEGLLVKEPGERVDPEEVERVLAAVAEGWPAYEPEPEDEVPPEAAEVLVVPKAPRRLVQEGESRGLLVTAVGLIVLGLVLTGVGLTQPGKLAGFLFSEVSYVQAAEGDKQGLKRWPCDRLAGPENLAELGLERRVEPGLGNAVVRIPRGAERATAGDEGVFYRGHWGTVYVWDHPMGASEGELVPWVATSLDAEGEKRRVWPPGTCKARLNYKWSYGKEGQRYGLWVSLERPPYGSAGPRELALRIKNGWRPPEAP